MFYIIPHEVGPNSFLHFCPGCLVDGTNLKSLQLQIFETHCNPLNLKVLSTACLTIFLLTVVKFAWKIVIYYKIYNKITQIVQISNGVHFMIKLGLGTGPYFWLQVSQELRKKLIFCMLIFVGLFIVMIRLKKSSCQKLP